MEDPWYNPSLAGPSSGQMFDHPNRVEFHEGSQPHFTNVHGNADTHVHSVATGHQPTAMNGIATGIENTTSSFLDAPCDIWSESASYCGQLLRQGRGFPLYIPEPPDSLPNDYKLNGVAIGDVGRVTPDGAFDFFFNIYLEADHPINGNYVPDDFSTFKNRGIARDMIRSGQDPGNHVSTSSVQKLEPNPQFDEFPGGHFIFSCGAPQGAVLALPHGAHLQKLENLETLRTYIAKHAESWYKYIRGTRGRGLENGSLYLVTGWEKAPSWGMASFHTAGEEFQLTFKPTATPRAASTSTARLDPTSTPRIDSTSSYQYRWSGVSGRKNPAQTKRYNPSSTNGPSNQTTFIHGLSISVGTGIWAALFGKVQICELVKFQWGGANGNSMSHTYGSSSSSSFPGVFGGGGGGGGGGTNGRTHHVGESGPVVLSDLSPISKIFHPGKLINNYILQKAPRAKVVMSHDDDWRDILRDDPSAGSIIQNVSELLQRIDDQFSITDQDGATFLLSTLAHSRSDAVRHTPLGTHFSTALAAALPLTVSQSDQAPIAAKEISGTASLDSTTNMRNENVDRPDQMVSQTNINALGKALGSRSPARLSPQTSYRLNASSSASTTDSHFSPLHMQRAGADTPSSGTTHGLNVLPSLSMRTGGFFDSCNNFEVNGGQFTNVEGNMTRYSDNAVHSVNQGARARGSARPGYATTGPHYAQPKGNPSYGYSQFPAPPNPHPAPPNPQFQVPPNPQFQRPPNPQFQAPPNPQFQRQPYPPLQGPPNPQFHAPQYPQFQGLPPNNVHPHQTPNFGRSFSDSPAYAPSSQNSGPRLPDPRAVNPEGDLAAQIDARRAASAANPPFRNPPPLQSSFSTPEARRDFASNTRAPTWSSAPPPSQPIPNSNTRAPTRSSAQPPSLAMPMAIPDSSHRRSRTRRQVMYNSMPLSSSPEEADRASWEADRAADQALWEAADRASWVLPYSTPMNQYPPITSTSQQPRVPPSARARQKSRKMEVDESDSSDSEGTAKRRRRKKSTRH